MAMTDQLPVPIRKTRAATRARAGRCNGTYRRRRRAGLEECAIGVGS